MMTLSGFREEFGRRLRDARLGRRMTQNELGMAIGSSMQSISMYECGHRIPDVERVAAMCEALDADIGALVPRVVLEPAAPCCQMTIFDEIGE